MVGHDSKYVQMYRKRLHGLDLGCGVNRRNVKQLGPRTLRPRWQGVEAMTTPELRDLLARATKGPWRAVCKSHVTLVTRDSQGRNDDTGSVQICRIADAKDDDLRPFNGDRWEADAALIALAPTLAAELIEARAANVEAEDEIKIQRDSVDWCSREILRLAAERDAMREALEYVDGCFEAALAEGWIDVLSNGDHAAILSLWHRRLSYARDKFPAAFKENRDE
jgi:hypothetical protein